MHHVHLIVVPKGMSDLEPGAIWTCEFGVESSLKPRHTSEHFCWRAGLSKKEPFELAQTQIGTLAKS
jgi:hypothetical protein